MRQRVVAMVTAAAVALMGSSAKATTYGDCWEREEEQAAAVRDFQMKLMVAALQCQAAGDGAVLARYNRFVSTFKPDLSRSANTLQKRALRLHGPGGQRAFDRDMTRIANAYSNQQRGAEFCAQAADLADEAVAQAGQRLSDFIGLPEDIFEPRPVCTVRP